MYFFLTSSHRYSIRLTGGVRNNCILCQIPQSGALQESKNYISYNYQPTQPIGIWGIVVTTLGEDGI